MIGRHKLPTRITVKRIRRVKELIGLDLTSEDTQPMVAFAINPDTVLEVCMALYSDHIKEFGLTEDDFADLCGPEEVLALREEVTRQMRSFSPYWEMVCTQMEALLAGDTSLLEVVKEIQAQDPSGPSS